MRLDLTLLKNQLNRFADECRLTIEEIGALADRSFSVNEFKSRLDELCDKNIGKTSLEVLAGFGVRLPESFPEPKISSEPRPSENSPMQNEIVTIKEKIDRLEERDKSQKSESKS